MKILCINGWGGTLFRPLMSYLQAEDPDILCLQEVVHTPDTDKEWLIYRDGTHVLDQRARFFDDVQTALPDHLGIFCPAAQGILWEEDRRIPSQWGLATFVRRSLTLIGQIQGFVHKDFGPDGYGDHPRSRTAHGVRVWDRAQNRAVSVLHMHGLRDLAGKADTPARMVQTRRFSAMADALAQPDDACILCGDFNVTQTSRTLDMLRARGMTELVTAGGHPGTRTASYPKPGKFADYMLVNDAVAPYRFDVVRDPEVSDHCPLRLCF